VFEFTSDALGAQSGVGGGGRYDLLIEQLGGPPTPGVGWAAGIERILLASKREAAGSAPLVYVAHTDTTTKDAFQIARELYRAGHNVELEHAGRSMKGQMKHAGRIAADAVVVVDDDGITVRGGDSEQRAADRDEAVKIVREIL
jgi:histidyl-tRNA synthetase